MQVRQIASEETHPLRLKVLWPHLNPNQCALPIDALDSTYHFGTFVDGKLVSIATFLVQDHEDLKAKSQYRLRAMATDPDYRGKGAGAALVRDALSFFRSRKVDLIWCDARLVAIDFYLKLDFSVIDEIYEVPKIGPHKLMFIKL